MIFRGLSTCGAGGRRFRTPNAEHEAALITEPVKYAGRRIHFARNLLFLVLEVGPHSSNGDVNHAMQVSCFLGGAFRLADGWAADGASLACLGVPNGHSLGSHRHPYKSRMG